MVVLEFIEGIIGTKNCESLAVISFWSLGALRTLRAVSPGGPCFPVSAPEAYGVIHFVHLGLAASNSARGVATSHHTPPGIGAGSRSQSGEGTTCSSAFPVRWMSSPVFASSQTSSLPGRSRPLGSR